MSAGGSQASVFDVNADPLELFDHAAIQRLKAHREVIVLAYKALRAPREFGEQLLIDASILRSLPREELVPQLREGPEEEVRKRKIELAAAALFSEWYGRPGPPTATIAEIRQLVPDIDDRVPFAGRVKDGQPNSDPDPAAAAAASAAVPGVRRCVMPPRRNRQAFAKAVEANLRAAAQLQMAQE